MSQLQVKGCGHLDFVNEDGSLRSAGKRAEEEKRAAEIQAERERRIAAARAAQRQIALLKTNGIAIRPGVDVDSVIEAKKWLETQGVDCLVWRTVDEDNPHMGTFAISIGVSTAVDSSDRAAATTQYYDHIGHRMILVLPAWNDGLTIAHELVHALLGGAVPHDTHPSSLFYESVTPSTSWFVEPHTSRMLSQICGTRGS